MIAARNRHAPLLLAAAFAACPASAAEQPHYVYCDTGIECFTTPCPPGNALHLSSGALIRGVTIDPHALPAKDKELDQSKAVRAGGVVVRGSIEERVETFHGNAVTMRYLMPTAVERAATASESTQCLARD